MPSHAEQLKEVEISIESAKDAVARKEALKKLYSNKDFNRIILNGYFIDEAARLVRMKADPAMQTPESTRIVDNSIIAIGYLQQYLLKVDRVGDMAANSIRDMEETRVDLLADSLLDNGE